ncbi:MAG: segregation/condensation protein A [Clostridiaceae bacterium]|jgi:segregation and condensation protein A|nr:segregation/condensation protein A [Clostridiaceae bacterium]
MSEVQLYNEDNGLHINITGNISAELADLDTGLFGMKKRELVYHLGSWEGPIALLYDLVQRNEIEIRDIMVSDVIMQFVDIVMSADDIDAEYASEFLVVAAKLISLKSKRLLAQDILTMEDQQEEEAVFQPLEEYALLQQAATNLSFFETHGRIRRDPEYREDDVKLVFKDCQIEKLVEAYARFLLDMEHNPTREIEPKKIYKEIRTVAERFTYINELIAREKEVLFFELFEADFEKLDIINTFLALLELLKRQQIEVVQTEIYGDITIKYKDGRTEILELSPEESKEVGEH